MIKMYNQFKILVQQMLKSLLGKIKSQKSEALSSNKSSPNTQGQTQKKYSQQNFTRYDQLRQDIEIMSEIRKIRYFAFETCPNLYNKILACPISTFNILPYAKRKVKQIDLTKLPLPQYLDPLKEILAKQLPNFNHLLINIYSPGVGIMPHFDGPLYKSKVVVLSLGGPAIINFTDSYKNINKCSKLLLEDHSIHIFQQQAYVKYLHGIEEFTIDSVFIKVQQATQGLGYKIIRSSVDNFHLTRIPTIIFRTIQNLENNNEQQEIDISKEVGCTCCLIRIKQNEQYNYKIEFVRQQRISITIRQKISDSA